MLKTLLLFSLLICSGTAFADAVCVKKKTTALLEKPDQKARLVKNLKKNTPLRLTGQRSGSYIQVENMEGHVAWVLRKDVSQNQNCVSVTVQKVRLKRGPSPKYASSSIVATRGQVFIDRGGEDGWTEVEDEKGQRAWIELEDLWRPRENKRISFEN